MAPATEEREALINQATNLLEHWVSGKQSSEPDTKVYPEVIRLVRHKVLGLIPVTRKVTGTREIKGWRLPPNANQIFALEDGTIYLSLEVMPGVQLPAQIEMSVRVMQRVPLSSFLVSMDDLDAIVTALSHPV